MEDIKNYLRNELQKVDNIIIDLATNRHDLIVAISNYIVSSGGKKLRAIFTILSAKMFGYNGLSHIGLASAIEAIHTATLLHDDVVDNSSLRRGKATANYLWDNQASILVGDFLFSQSFQLMVKYGNIEILDILSKTSSIIAEGEVMQMGAICKYDIKSEEYFKIITSKTAELFASACKVGALIAGQTKQIADKFYNIGLDFGLAYQISDDLLDYRFENNLGKNSGDDFIEGKITLPLILLLEVIEKKDKDKIIALCTQEERNNDDFLYIVSLIKKYDIEKIIIKKLEEYSKNISKNLDFLPQSAEKDIFKKLSMIPIKRIVD